MIHSLDSSVLILFVRNFNQECYKLRKKGVYLNIITVHDCFATSVGNVELMEKLVRESFIQIYREPEFLKKFIDIILTEALEQHMKSTGKTAENLEKEDIKLPDYPILGEFDVREVLKSKYFIN